MIKTASWAALGAFLFFDLASPGWAADPDEAPSPDEVRTVTERLLGSGEEEAQMRSYLPFTRQFGASGVVAGSLGASTAAAGVPPAAMVEALRAFSASIDVERDPRDGDRFYVRYQRTFTAEGHPVGIGRVLWAELHLATKGTIAIHRFRPSGHPWNSFGAAAPFWLANGESTAPPSIRLPIERVVVSSAFGMRADPMDQPSARIAVGGPRFVPHLPPGLKSSNADAVDPVNGTTPLGRSLGLSPGGASQSSAPSAGLSQVNGTTSLGLSLGLSPGGTSRSGPAARPLVMHEGVDLAAPPGTPLFAAGDGTVKGAAPHGGYGNWILIEHDGGKLSTVYGHLAAFAPGIEPGARVVQGEVIGFVGNTGRSTGPHLHFELLSDGKPVNPMSHPAAKHAQLRGRDLERFRAQTKRALRERELEDIPVPSGS
jgi:murein DD-endopeptidase MepM/ murein hydrolase activator NlpD